MRPFVRKHGRVLVRLRDDEVAVIHSLASQLVEMLLEREAETVDPADALLAQLGIGGGDSVPLDPALARLLPDAYRGQAEAASEHRHLTERGLIDRKVANAQAVSEVRGPETVLDDAAIQSWLRTLTDLRLVIAARLQIEQDGDIGIGDDTMLDLYDWLGHLQSSLLDVIDP